MTSDPARVGITITPVNDAPTSVADTRTITRAQATAGFAINMIANDTDVDGNADVVAAQIRSLPTRTNGNNGTATIGVANNTVVNGGTVTFRTTGITGTGNRTFQFTYRARDAAGLNGATVTVTVTVTP